MGTERRQSMGEQQFQQQFQQGFEERVRFFQDQENTYMRDTYETNEIQRHLQATDEKSEKLHHGMEKEYYRQLSQFGGVSFEMTSFAERQSLVPKINDTGMSKKRKEKLVNRTKKQLETGKKVLGKGADEYVTAQTIPLMRSLKKNGEALRKQREKQKEDEKADIIALSSMVIPADLFEFEITEKHSHFDVKKALKIRDSLDRIEKYKAANSFEYFMFDNDVQARLDALLLCKPIFERTLTVALAANGVSLEKEGEKLDVDRIKSARREYYGVTEAYKEQMANFQSTVDSVKEATKLMVKKKQPSIARDHTRKSEIRDRILDEWESFNDPDFKSKSMLPEAFVERSGEAYSRSIHRMVEGGEDEASQQEAKQASYKALKMSMLSATLTNKGPQPAENLELLKQYKELITPHFEAYREKTAEMLEFVRNATFDELLSRYEEIFSFEIGYQSLADYLKVTDADGRMLKDVLADDKSEIDLMNKSIQLISDVRKAVDEALVLKRLSYGEKIPGEELSKNAQNTVQVLDGAVLENSDETKIQNMKDALTSTEHRLNSDENKIQIFWTQERKKIKERIERDKTIDKEMEALLPKQQTEFGEMLEKGPAGVLQGQSKTESESSVVDLSAAKEMFLASGMKTKNQIGGKGDGGKDLTFRETMRELFGNPSIEKGLEKAKITERYVKLEDFLKIFKKTQIPNESGDGFSEKVEIDREGLMNLLKPVLDFDSEKYWKGVSRDVFSDMQKRVDFATEMKEKLHFLTNFTQWTDKMDLSPYLEKSVLEEIDKKRDMFRVITGYADKIGSPFVTEKSFFDRELPYFPEVLESTLYRKELGTARDEAISEYMQAHPQVSYAPGELKEFTYHGPQSTFYGEEKRDEHGNIILPVTKEECEKLKTADMDMVKTLASEISGFSLVTQTGRKRLLFDDRVRDLMKTGKDDLRYYAEFDRKARMLVMASYANMDGVKKALGKDTDEVLQACKTIMGVFITFEKKMREAQSELPDLRDDVKRISGESVEAVKIMREEEHEKVILSQKKTWSIGAIGGRDWYN